MDRRTEIAGYYGIARRSTSQLIDHYKPHLGFWAGTVALAGVLLLGVSQCYQSMIDAEVSDWAAKWTDKLRDPQNSLSEGERYYSKVKVVGAGRTLAEKLEMERGANWINVRNYPAIHFNREPISGFETRIIGKVLIGSEVYNVVVSNGWGMTWCDNIRGLVREDPVKQTDICAINADYLQKTGENHQQAPALQNSASGVK